MADANREAAATRRSPAPAKRGLLSERAWADVRRAALLAHETRTIVKLHGVVITGDVNHELKSMVKASGSKVQSKPVEAAGDRLDSAAAGDAPPPPGERRKARSARRQLEHQEQKRAGFIAQLVANGCELAHAQAAVADGERARLARLAQRGAVPMDAEAAPAARAP